MKYSIINVCLALIVLSSCLSCRSANSSTFSYTKPEIILLREMPNGTIFVRAFGSGFNQMECIENAKLSAIREVIFNGVNGSKPLIGGANTEEKNKERKIKEKNELIRQMGSIPKIEIKEIGDKKIVQGEILSRSDYQKILDLTE